MLKPISRGLFAFSRAAVIVVVILFDLIGSTGCESVSSSPKVPYIPPEYFDCNEITPQVLCDSYFSKYFITTESEFRYNGLYFVFKNILVTELMFKHLDEGYFWADNLVRCYCLSPNDLNQYKIGDRIDVVGKNQGDERGVQGLKFTGCIIIPAGAVQLPAPGGGGMVVPIY
jgi:hypothetical protein